MATQIRAEISDKNKYWIDKHRYYELKHFCLQYNEWKRAYEDAEVSNLGVSKFDRLPSSSVPGDLTADCAIKRAGYAERISIIEKAAMETDEFLCSYILKAVTEGLSFTQLKTKLGIPCGRDMYYDRYRRFFWLLCKLRD